MSENDRLIIAGDCIDRGGQSYEMLQWLEKCPPNVTLLRGNHDEKFSEYVELMLMLDRDEELSTDFSSNEDAIALYRSVRYFIKSNALTFLDFDLYGTIEKLLTEHNITLGDLSKWAETFQKMPYYAKLEINGRTCVAVHAGYTENIDNLGENFDCVEDFYLYAREEGYLLGGIPHGMIIAGHTPTIADEKFAYTGGEVFRYYDAEKDCIFYDVDCGCAFRNINRDARLACIRLEDEKIFYI
ncbi:MAG: metallophosphoesterase [Lachnospiraceae bacterium]|nr:metallophosphoesterase [Ruminococcus sp.]MCM1275571.1 metallophosphoesterase [Lachnospiraceae bacterium]